MSNHWQTCPNGFAAAMRKCAWGWRIRRGVWTPDAFVESDGEERLFIHSGGESCVLWLPEPDDVRATDWVCAHGAANLTIVDDPPAPRFTDREYRVDTRRISSGVNTSVRSLLDDMGWL